MARGRMIDKVIILSTKINNISEGAENLYYRIYVNTDDFGLFHADPKILKGQIYTLRNISIATIEKRLNELIEISLIKIYKNNDEKYLEIVDFEKHQIFRKDYTKKAEYPRPSTKSYEIVQVRTKSRSKLNKIKLKEVKLNNSGTESFDEEFEEFWKFYRSIGNSEDDIGDKQEAKKAYNILRKTISKKEIAKATHGEADYLKYKRLRENFIQRKKFASTWLRSNRWQAHKDFKYEPTL